MLRFHAEAVAELIGPAAFAGELAVEEVAGIELQPRLSGQDLQHATRGRFRHARHEAELPQRLIDDPVVVVTVAELKLLVVLTNARADGRRGAEIKGCAV